MCLYPRIIQNGKYKSNKKNNRSPPPIKDKRVQVVPIGCGNCIECRKQKSRDWQVRLQEDIKTNKNGKFITLTFSNESIAALTKELPKIQGYYLDNQIATLAMRRFNERYRKKYKKAIRHWTVTELGHNGTENIHLHGIIWTDVNLDEIEKIWKYGHIWKYKVEKGIKVNYVSTRTVNYIVKYVNKIDEKHKYYKSIVLTSPGIGSNYINTINATKNKYNGNKTNETYRTSTGHKIALPIYYKNKIYNDEEREKLWINKLDKEERWICGIKIDISKDETAYYSVLKHHRTINAQLGYGDNIKDWTREKYEQERRILMQQKRIQNAK